MERKPTMGDEHEFDRQPAKIEWYGPLDGGHENAEVWRGKISAKLESVAERFGFPSPERARQELDHLKEQAARFYVKANILARVRCIDGRGEEEMSDERELGPQVPGGAPVMMLGWRVAEGLVPGANIDSDVVQFKERLKELDLPYVPGAHEDEHNAGHPENTGCGAIDKMLEILKIMTEQDEIEGRKKYLVYDYTRIIALEYCGDDPDTFDRIFDDIQVKLEVLNSPRYNDRYFMKDEKTGEHRFRKRVVNRIKEVGQQTGKKTVEKLRGSHNELFLLINKVHGETFDRDGFAALTDGKGQAFGYDVWHALERARALFPDDEEKQRTMIVTNVIYAVATAMALTDGSLEVGTRK